MAKKSSKTRPGRDSDQFVVRMPGGMRDALAKLAAERGRSMNAEVVFAVQKHIDFSTAPAEQGGVVLSEVGLYQISKQIMASVEILDRLTFDVRDIDLDAFIADQRSQGDNLTRTEAIRKILRDYLQEHGYVRQPST